MDIETHEMESRKSTALSIAVMVIAAFTLLLVTMTPINGDVAFLVHMAKNTALSNFYQQFYEVNPPLIVYLYKLFLVPYHLGFLSDISSIRLGTSIYLLGSVWVCAKVLSHLTKEQREPLILAIALSLLIINPLMFSQREQFIAAGLMVYFAFSYACFYTAHSAGLKVVTAFFLALSLSLKPQYGTVFLLVEAYLWFRYGNANKRLFYIAVVSFGALYVASVYWFNEDYLSIIVPWAREYYSSYFKDFSDVVGVAVLLLVTTVPSYLYLRTLKYDHRCLELGAVFLIGALVAFVSGRTAFSYHLIPASAFSYLLVNLSLIVGVRSMLTRFELKQILVITVLGPLVIWQWPYFMKVPQFSLNSSVSRLMSESQELHKDMIIDKDLLDFSDAIREVSTPGDGIVFLASKGMYLQHSIPLHNSLDWSSRMPNFWLLPNAIERKDEPEQKKHIAWIQKAVIADFEKMKPNVLIKEEYDADRKPKHKLVLQTLEQSPPLKSIIDRYQFVSSHRYKYSVYHLYVLKGD
ncbi:hypothetical protein [Vibrio maritimus]|uniref:hypothetical protein n=1 Tax=Vibrio maritimus TaxID=990268 RepID=UPI001F432D62|nr:hypothetical protein [Vibrio maritimus]